MQHPLLVQPAAAGSCPSRPGSGERRSARCAPRGGPSRRRSEVRAAARASTRTSPRARRSGTSGIGPLDELRLAAAAVRRDDHPPRDAVRGSAPRSRRTMCRQRSMPAATPADVRIAPSSTHRTSGSTVDRWMALGEVAASRQCVAARRPSSSPASARTKAPVQIHDDARAAGVRVRSASSTAAGHAAVRSPTPGTTTVSAHASASGPCAASDREARRGRHRTGLHAADAASVALALVDVAEDLRRDGEVERHDAVDGEDRRRGAWLDSCALCRSCHWRMLARRRTSTHGHRRAPLRRLRRARRHRPYEVFRPRRGPRRPDREPRGARGRPGGPRRPRRRVARRTAPSPCGPTCWSSRAAAGSRRPARCARRGAARRTAGPLAVRTPRERGRRRVHRRDLLAAAGVLRGRPATTHHLAIDDLRGERRRVVDARVVDDGDLLTAGGAMSGSTSPCRSSSASPARAGRGRRGGDPLRAPCRRGLSA